MSEENVEAIRANFERFARGDFSEITDLTPPLQVPLKRNQRAQRAAYNGPLIA
jgi:hypothetical protein